jgi:ferritin-like metal-binding protein YciE
MEEIKKLHDLYLTELKDIYNAEKQIMTALPKMITKVKSERLRLAFEEHMEVSKKQIERLEEAFKELELKASGEQCKAMKGIITETEELVKGSDKESFVLDALLIASAQKIEHYEIAGYGTLLQYAEILGYTESAKLLEQNLNEEKQMDELLTKIASEGINLKAEIGQ